MKSVSIIAILLHEFCFLSYKKRLEYKREGFFPSLFTIEPFNFDLAKRLFAKYLDSNEKDRDSRFKNQDPKNVFIRFVPETVVVRDQSYNVNR